MSLQSGVLVLVFLNLSMWRGASAWVAALHVGTALLSSAWL